MSSLPSLSLRLLQSVAIGCGCCNVFGSVLCCNTQSGTFSGHLSGKTYRHSEPQNLRTSEPQNLRTSEPQGLRGKP